MDCFDHAIDLASQELAHIVERSLWWRSPHAAALNERQRQVLERLWGDFKGHLTTTKYAKLAHCSQDTALRNIQAFVARGILVANPSGGRSTSYRLAPKST